jgi:flagellar biosynthesis GTPase FlhF
MSTNIYTEDEQRKTKREYNRKWKKEHKEQYRAQQLKWRKEHPEQYRANFRKWRKEHPEKCRARAAEWNKAHPEKCRESIRKWHRSHPIEHQVNHNNFTCKRLGIPGKIDSMDWKILLFLSFNCCLSCNKASSEVGTLHIDHVIPQHLKTGKVNSKCKNTIDNVQPLCVFCNCAKHLKRTDFRA